MLGPEGGDFMGSVGDMLPDPFEQLRNRSIGFQNQDIDQLVCKHRH